MKLKKIDEKKIEKMLEKNWTKKKEFWLRKGEYGTTIINRQNRRRDESCNLCEGK